jgi:hypothetical protein
MLEPEILLRDVVIPEPPRWHEGRPWFCNWIDRPVVAVGLDGKPEVMVTRDLGSHPIGTPSDRSRRSSATVSAMPAATSSASSTPTAYSKATTRWPRTPA